MGLNTNSRNVTFLRTKNGKFYLSSDKEFKKQIDSVSGILSKIEPKTDSINGADVEVTYFELRDGNETYRFNIKRESQSYTNIIGMLINADLSKTVEFVAIGEKDKNDPTKVFTSMTLKQGSTWMSSAFKKGSGNELPTWVKVKISGKDVWDKTAYLDKISEHVVELQGKLVVFDDQEEYTPPVEEPRFSNQGGAVAQNAMNTPAAPAEDDDDLPF